ncbi:hypothetical protein METBIDRAFT_9667 [Metschnikowia bicuspidata var. bicuspidata NRRL YB-4993]|uniref:Inner centromere protein ARK-binding domain-containing protein n=1 Tax=Metschnikowia bicuspidata var. bicuspidata NRRL YB-4993 TaxID=869754 RepID=A0A1A0HHB8_9ASCO|nr:hypothetical protein METBIDRAFT_9667 [Metschnikowia bicuspidata var. bicuspidata NRRL YB-4993]OBA23396.1 hypothetical protein METBIDRAFT_9667 [Metschnikowia bicuspidata var. bicuspidata NRRL YB-4993]
MNLALWALTAARKGRKKQMVPGSSGHIVEETASNLRTTKEAKELILLLVEKSVSSLNCIIDAINNDASYEDLLSLVQLSQPPPDSPIEDSFRSTSSVSRSEWDSQEPSSKPELLLQHSEKITSSSAPPASDPILHGLPADDPESPLPGPAFKPPSTDSTESCLADSREHMRDLRVFLPRNETLSSKIKVKVETSNDRSFLEDTASAPPLGLPDPINPLAENIHGLADAPIQNDATIRPSHVGANELHWGAKMSTKNIASASKLNVSLNDPSSFSPIKIVNGRVASFTAPDVDVSSNPLSLAVNSKYSAEEPSAKITKTNDTNGSDDGADNSFQAISTAIRKSFAGKTSMGLHPGLSSLHNDVQSDILASHTLFTGNDQKNSNYVLRSLPKPDASIKNVKVKMEPDPDSVKAPPKVESSNSRSRSNTSSYTGIVFVSLPNKEPIKIHPTTQAGAGETERRKENSLASNVHFSQSIHTADQTNQPLEPHPRKTKCRGEDSQNESNQAKPPAPVPNLFSKKVFSNILPPPKKVSKSPVKSMRLSPTKFPSHRLPDRLSTRTTNAGSPIKREIASKPPFIGRSPVKSRVAEPLSRLTASSSVSSSRSPTNYSHKSDRGSIRGSMTNVSIHQAQNLAKYRSQQEIFPPSGPEKDGKSFSSDKDFLKNRFLTTALLPNNTRRLRKLVHPDNVQSHIPKALVESHAGPLKLTSHFRDLKSAVRPELEPKPELFPHLQSTSDPRLALKKDFLSPEKREVTKVDRSQALLKKVRTPSIGIPSTHNTSKKRAIGNAVPLPDAARGKFRKESTTKPFPRDVRGSRTPSKFPSVNPRARVLHGLHPETLPDSLPDIPSDDDLLRDTKHVKSWAGTPEILRAMNEKLNLDPKAVFGECTDLDMEDVFRSVKSRSDRVPLRTM